MKTALAVSLLAVSASTVFATTTDELKIVSGSVTATILSNGTCTGNGCVDLTLKSGTASAVLASGSSFDGWDINLDFGTNNSPGLIPDGIQNYANVYCTSGTCTTHPLEVFYSATPFNVPEGPNGFLETFAGAITGTGSHAVADEDGWFSNGGGLLSETSSIGSISVNSGMSQPVSGSKAGGTASTNTSYSLTLEDIFSAGGHSASFSMTGEIIPAIPPTPEPAAVVLFGTVLAFCASKLRRRLRS